jgi:hypothetical protein
MVELKATKLLTVEAHAPVPERAGPLDVEVIATKQMSKSGARIIMPEIARIISTILFGPDPIGDLGSARPILQTSSKSAKLVIPVLQKIR